jgi:AcrR family transcriptional regulator
MSTRGRPRSFDREQALRQAMEVFWTKGYEHASLSHLTAAMDINPPSLYAAFGCKEALFHEAVELYARTEGAGIWEYLSRAPTAREAVEWLLRRSAESFTRGKVPRGCLIVLAAPQQDGASEPVLEALRARRRHGTELLAARLRRAVREGELPAGVDCRAVANFYTTLQHGMSIQARDGASRKALLAVAECGIASWDALIGGSRRG